MPRTLPVLLHSLLLAALLPAGPVAAAAPRDAGFTSALARCALASPLRALGPGADAPGRIDLQPYRERGRAAATGGGPQHCRENQHFLLGTGVHDMTGPAGDSISAGYENPEHVLRGIHTRQFARAFAIASPCNGERVMMVVSETAFITQGTRQTVLDLVAADPELSPHYNGQNILLSATHTHSAPGGEAHHTAYNLFRMGYDEYVHRVYTQAIHHAIRRAHRNLQANQKPGRIRLVLGELLDANTNRSEPAYANNPEQERASWLNEKGEEVRVNKRMVQLLLERPDGTPVGLLNWFGVHTTSVGTHEPLISSDNKGLAAVTMERMFGTDYTDDGGGDQFVAAFAQSDEGDSSPNLCFREHPYPDVRIGCGENTLHSNAAHGVKQLARAIELFGEKGQPLRGPVTSRLFHVPMDRITVEDPVILESLQHDDSLDEPVKRTCSAALGYSMAAGAEDNRGPSQEGIRCGDPQPLEAIQRDIQTALDTMAAYANGRGYLVIPAATGGMTACGLNRLPGLPDADYSCQAEKPVLFPVGTTEHISNSDLPFQLVRLGNLVVIALPWEVTTTSARRLRDTVLRELHTVGVEYAVVASLANDFVQYLTTREEYATQQYEGASTHFGPWTLAAVQQEMRRLALSLRDGLPPPAGASEPRTTPAPPNRAAYRPGDAPPDGAAFGQVLLDAGDAYAAGDTVRARFAGGHPRNDTLEKLNGSYLQVEVLQEDGGWAYVASEREPELIMRWHSEPEWPMSGQSNWRRVSEIEAIWHVPEHQQAGSYRIRYNGTVVPSRDQPDAGQARPVEGTSSTFTVSAGTADCPGYPALF